MRRLRLTPQLVLVLRQALVSPDREWFGREMATVTGLPEATVYQMAGRLEARGLLASRDEERGERWPAPGNVRRYFRLTPAGVEAARAAEAAAGGGRVDRTAPIPWPDTDAGGVLEVAL